MLSTANLSLLSLLTGIEETTLGFVKNLQNVMCTSGFTTTQHQDFSIQKSQAKNKRCQPLHLLRGDPFSVVCGYLQPEELCKVRATCSFANEVINRYSNIYFKRHCKRIYGPTAELTLVNNHLLNFLSLRIADLEAKRCQLRSLENVYRGVDEYHRHGFRGIIGVVPDLVWVEDEAVAKTISRKRFMAMSTIITNSEGDITKFKSVNKALRGASSFMPYSTAARSIVNTTHIDMLKRDIDAIGFIGYAVNLLRMRPEHEYLRYTVFWIVFKNLMIFDSDLNMLSYAESLETPEEIEDFWAVSLGRYESETEHVYPRLFSFQNQCYEDKREISRKLYSIEKSIQDSKHSCTFIRYT